MKIKTKQIILGLAVFILGVGYVMQLNVVSGRGYDLKKLEKSVQESKHELSQLEYKIAVETSSKALEEKSLAIGMREPLSIQYVLVGGGSVALK